MSENIWAVQEVLDAAADDARRAAAEAHYTGCRIRHDSKAVELWLFNASAQLLRQIEAMHPGTYVIHDDAPRSRSAVLEVMDALDPVPLKAEGIDVVGYGPTEDGYLRVSVMGDVAAAQARLDAMHGPNLVRVEYGEPARAV